MGILETKKRVACFGSGKGQYGEPLYDAMEQVGFLLAKQNYVVVTGGFGGAGMEAPARGASRGEGFAIGYPILAQPPNQFLTHTHDCRFFNSQLLPAELQYTVRLGYLLTAHGFIVAANGGAGTLVEFLAVVNLNQKIWTHREKPCAILNPPQAHVVGWDETMLDDLEKIGVITPECRKFLKIVGTPEEAVAWATAH